MKHDQTRIELMIFEPLYRFNKYTVKYEIDFQSELNRFSISLIARFD